MKTQEDFQREALERIAQQEKVPAFVGTTFSLDLGSSHPICVRVHEIRDNDVVVKYLGVPDRFETWTKDELRQLALQNLDFDAEVTYRIAMELTAEEIEVLLRQLRSAYAFWSWFVKDGQERANKLQDKFKKAIDDTEYASGDTPY